ncbi:MAG: DUF928 domain-containing protein [Hydrococcus sp. Prado102]|jgi:hypothetical protein|nr:DUF928 domain-containing protein [Hydrococcus sp. Prado102]
MKSFQVIIIGLLASCAVAPRQIQAQSLQVLSDSNRGTLQFNFSPPATQDPNGDREGRPPNRTSGGSRSNCLQQVVAMVPGKGTVDVQDNKCLAQSESFPALTVSATPTFWFYVPAPENPNLSAEFVLFEGDRLVYKKQVPLSETPGIISFRPEQSLKTSKQYRWFFSVLINPQRPSQNPVVEGSLERIEMNATLKSQLKTASSERDRAAIYASYGIWYDALTELGELYRTNPQDRKVQADWADLLNSVGLGEIAKVPIVDCCRANETMLGNRQ